MKKFVAVFLLLSFWGSAQSVDFTHLSLSIAPDTNIEEVSGSVSLKYFSKNPVDSIWLDGIRMNYQKVEWNGGDIDYDFNEKGIWLRPDISQNQDTNQIFMAYRCKPRKGIYFIGWDDETGLSKRQIWTQGQGIDHRHWIPHKDDQTDKMIINISVIFDKNYQVISNGELYNKKMIDSTQIWWSYSMQKPMSSYLIAIAIGKYDSIQTSSKSEISLTQYFYPKRANDYEIYYAKNEEIFNYLEGEIGVLFPWQNYKQVPVQDFRHGAMENTTATIFGDFFLVDSIAMNDVNYTYVNAHELAHQWFGNLVTAANSDHHWLHEGFATYYQWLSERNLYGQDYFDWERKKAADLVFAASRQDSIPLGNGKAGSARFYQKGAWVLYMLQNQIGEENFRKSINKYLNKNAFGVVTTDVLQNIIDEITTKNHDLFFESWIEKSGEPLIFITEKAQKKNKISFDIVLRNNNGETPLVHSEMAFLYEDGTSQMEKLEMKGAGQYVDFQLDKNRKLEAWYFNPEMKTLLQKKETKPAKMWVAQLKKSPHFLDRLDAVVNLARVPFSVKSAALENAFKNENEHFSVRVAALAQLLENDAEKYEPLLLKSLQSPDIQLQKEAISLIYDRTDTIAKVLANLRKGRSYDLRQNAIHKSIDAQNPENNRWLYDEIYDEQPGIPGHKVKITALTYRVLLFGDGKAFDELVFFTSSGFDFLTRINALNAVGSLREVSNDLITNTFEAFFDSNWKLRGQARNLLKKWYENQGYRKSIDNFIQNHRADWDEFQEKSVARTFGRNLD